MYPKKFIIQKTPESAEFMMEFDFEEHLWFEHHKTMDGWKANQSTHDEASMKELLTAHNYHISQVIQPLVTVEFYLPRAYGV